MKAALRRVLCAPLLVMLLVALLLVACSADAARAFSDPTSFGFPPEAGGGGGRYFTGSPADGHGCGVCHAGAIGPALRVLGLPTDGYALGASYEITLQWPEDAQHIALALELTDERGAGAGELRLPQAAELHDAERCSETDGGIAAGVPQDAGAQRTILNVPDCGARRLRFLWTAPSEDRGRVWFAGAIVQANGDELADGDGVTSIAHVLSSPSKPAYAAEINGGCSIHDARATPASAAPAIVLLAGLSLARRRQLARRRAVTRNSRLQ